MGDEPFRVDPLICILCVVYIYSRDETAWGWKALVKL
jgi:hypothetical protein